MGVNVTWPHEPGSHRRVIVRNFMAGHSVKSLADTYGCSHREIESILRDGLEPVQQCRNP